MKQIVVGDKPNISIKLKIMQHYDGLSDAKNTPFMFTGEMYVLLDNY